MFLFNRDKMKMPTPETPCPAGASPSCPIRVRTACSARPSPARTRTAFGVAEFALGCFWGEEKTFWEQPGVWTTAVGYEGGYTPNPTYQESCTGKTGHAETVRVVFDPSKTSYEKLLKVFWENHDPTQGMRQGNDTGTRVPVGDLRPRRRPARRGRGVKADVPGTAISARGYGEITTEIVGPPAPPFYFAEDYHQQYLKVNPDGYCPNHATGVKLPDGFAVTPLQYGE